MRRNQDPERGNITINIIIFAVGLFLMIGLVVDGGGKVNAGVQAQQLAASAARAGANSLSADAVANGSRVVDPARARTIAAQTAAIGGGTATVTVNGDTVNVTVVMRYRTVFLKILNINSLDGTGQASARIVSQ